MKPTTFKQPKKFKSADEKRAFFDAQEKWLALQAKHAPVKPIATPKRECLDYKLDNPVGRERQHHPSLVTPGNNTATKGEQTRYTGTLVKGISIVHKSYLAPVFSDEQAVEFASMRR